MNGSHSTFDAGADQIGSVVNSLQLVTKQTSLTVPKTPPSHQIVGDELSSMWGRIIEPPLPLDQMLVLFHTIPIHSACIIVKAVDATGLGWRLVPRAASRTPSRLTREQERLDTKLQQLTPEITFSEMLQQAAREREIFGWSFWEVLRHPTATAELGEIGALYPIPGHTIRATKDRDLYVQIKADKQRWFKRFGSRRNIYAETGEDVKLGENPNSNLLASELLKFGGYSPESSYYPVPDWVSAIPSMAELAAIREFNITWFTSGGSADRIIVVTGNSGAVAKSMSDDIETKLREARGKGHVTLSVWGTADVKVAVTNMNAGTGRGEGNRERQFRGGREDLVREVLMAHQVPPYRVGWAELGSLGGSAAKEMLRAYRYGGIEPTQVILEDRLAGTLFGPDGFNLKTARWTLIDLDWDTLELDIDRAQRGVSTGIMTPNEARQMLGMDMSDNKNLDKFYMQTTIQSLEQTLKPPQPKPAPFGAKPTDPGGESDGLRKQPTGLVGRRGVGGAPA